MTRPAQTLLIMGLLAVVLFAGEKIDIDGYWKNFFSMANPVEIEGIEDTGPTGSANYRLNIKLAYDPLDIISLRFSYDIEPRITSGESTADLFFESFSGSTYRIDDLESPFWPEDFEGEGFALYQNLDRLYAAFELPFADVRVGRQAVAWGNARAVNPTDVLVPFSFDALDTEERPGVDAFRARFPIGMMSELDFGYLPGEEWDIATMAAFARGKFYYLETDVTLTAMLFREDALAGIDIARAIGGAGSWLEASFVQPALAIDSLDLDPYFRLTIGADYILGDGTYLFGEYHYNGAGANDPAVYLENFSTSRAYSQGGVYLMGQHYLIAGGSYQFTPLISGGGQIMFNATDISGLIAPSLEYNIAQNVYLSAGAFIGVGSSMKMGSPAGLFEVPPLDIDFGSEFGNYPDMAFASFRVYF
ncbi:MAG: hypothetical protein ACP5G4_11010 [bacterium]